MHHSFFRLRRQYSWCIILNYVSIRAAGDKVFLRGGGIGLVWTRAIVVIARSVNRSAITCKFFCLSIYLWLLSDFLIQILFLLLKKVGLVCGSVLSVLYCEKLCLSALFSPCRFTFICYFCLVFIFYVLFLLSIVYIVFKISILILWSGGVEKVGFKVRLLQWYVPRFTIMPYRLANAIVGGDFKYFQFLNCY